MAPLWALYGHTKKITCSCCLVFVLNHASPDDFQPFTLREAQILLAESFQGAKFIINSGISLYKSGIIPTGKSFPLRNGAKSNDDIDPAEVNLHLLPTNSGATDTFSVYTASKPENAGEFQYSLICINQSCMARHTSRWDLVQVREGGYLRTQCSLRGLSKNLSCMARHTLMGSGPSEGGGLFENSMLSLEGSYG